MSCIHIAKYPCSVIALHLHNTISEQLLTGQLRCVAPRKRGEQAEVGRTRLFPLALRGNADLSIPAVYFPPRC